MEQMNLFAMMGMSAPAAPAEKATKKAEVKAAPKKDDKTEVKKVKLPCKVIAGAWVAEIAGDGEKNIDEIKSQLIEMGYDELKSRNTSMRIDGANVLVGLPTNATYGPAKVSAGAVVALGGFKFEASEDELTLDQLGKDFIENNPQYTGCRFSTDYSSNVIVPIGSNAAVEVEDEKEYNIIFNGEVQAAKGKDLMETLSIPNSAKRNMKLFPCGENYIVTLGIKDQSSATSTSSYKKKEEEKKLEVKLPVTMTFTHTADKELTPEMFGGKEIVTEKELQEWLMGQYEEYTADKTEFLYFKADNVIEARIKSSKRG